MSPRRHGLPAFRSSPGRLRLSRRGFERLVREALEDLPEEFASRLQNVAVLVEDYPDPARLEALGFDPDEMLLGLYEGIPLEDRSSGYHLVMPDRITIYRVPILETCASREEVIREVQKTVIHEVGHFFGLGDDELD